MKRLAILFGLPVLLAGCDQQSNQYDALEGEETSDTVASSSILITDSMSRDGNVVLKNNTAGTVLVERLVVNGVENDNDCDVRIFQEMAPGSEKQIDFGDCGTVRSTAVYTNQGVDIQDWTYQPFVNLSRRGNTVIIDNLGLERYLIERLELNENAQDDSCNIKLFHELAGETQLTVPVGSVCGDINVVKVITDRGSRVFEF